MHASQSNKLRFAALASASGAALALALVTPNIAMAQDADPGPAEVESVVVTASRIVRDGYEAPTPTTVVGAADIERQSVSNIANYIATLPQVGAGNSARTTTFFGIGGANAFNLRNLNTWRTLTLLDGRRVVGALLTGVVDVNLLPTNLVSRVDVVTGGASAAWGSDAVAGVVNFVLDKQFDGLKGSAGYGSSWRGDGTTYDADIAFGTKFDDGRGHLLLSARMENGDGIFNTNRDWYTGYKAVPNRARTATNGQPGFVALDHAGLSIATKGGVIFAGPLAGVQFGPGGTVLPYRPPTQGAGIIGAGGDVQDIGSDYIILPAIENESVFARVSYDLTDHVNAYVEGGLGWSYGRNLTSSSISFGNITIRSENPFIPAALDLKGQTSFTMGRVHNEDGLGPIVIENDRAQQRLVLGLEGDTDWFDSSFKWNAYYQHGETQLDTDYGHNLITANFQRAIDVVRNPAVGGVPGIAVGTPVCRSTITSPTNGCQPFNPFGEGSPSAQAVAYVSGVAQTNIRLKQDVAAAGFQFDPFSLPAGPVSLAGGVEWRKEKYFNTVDALDAQIAAPYFFGNFKPGQGAYNVKEAFGEVIVPILKDVPFVKSLDFNGAVRLTDYSTSGRVTTWKAGGTWDVNDDLRFRGTRSRDIRAPNLSDLFLGASGAGIGILVPGTNAQAFATTLNGGTTSLVPEVADTTAFGLVYRPSWLPGFSASIDRYKIDIDKAIVTVTAQQIVNLCYGVGAPATPAACAQISLNPAPPSNDLIGQLTAAIIRTGGANIGKQSVAGYDFEFSYRRELADIYQALPGQIDLRATGSYLTKFEQEVGGITTSYRNMVTRGNGPIAGGPNWRWLFTGTYTVGPSMTTATVRYVGKSVINNEPRNSPLAVDINRVKSAAYLDLNQAWNLQVRGADLQLFARLENVFDADPPKVASTEGTAYATSGTDYSYFDAVGRFWRVGVRFKY